MEREASATARDFCEMVLIANLTIDYPKYKNYFTSDGK